MNAHKFSIKKGGNSFIYQHFREHDNFHITSTEDLFSIQILEKICEMPEDDVNILTDRRTDREYWWMITLFTVFPFGLNDRVKGVGSIYSNSELETNFNHFVAFEALQKLKISTKKRKKRSVRYHVANEIEIRDILEDIVLQFSNKNGRYILNRISSFSNRLLLQIIKNHQFKTIPNQIQTIFKNFLLKRNGPPIQNIKKKFDMKNRTFLKIDFTTKIIQKLNLGRILNTKWIKDLIPGDCRYKKPPVIIYNYGRNIGSFLLNYSKDLKDLTINNMTDIDNMECSCDSSPFKDQHYGHILTGDLSIIENTELRNLMKKGTKYRESPSPNFKKLEYSLKSAVSEFIVNWSRKENKEEDEFNEYKYALFHELENKISQFGNCNNSSPTILQNILVKQYVSALHDKFIITVIDKASNNFGIICKKFYFQILAKELGLNNVNVGNDTYVLKEETDLEICSVIKRNLKDKFKIDIPQKLEKLPRIYWIPKFHKNPIGYRFISGSKAKILSLLEKPIGAILSRLEQHFHNYCNVVKNNSGYKHFFSIRNSREALNMLDAVKKTKYFDSFDFSNLYTNFKHEDLISKFSSLLDLLFKNSSKKDLKHIRVMRTKDKMFAYW